MQDYNIDHNLSNEKLLKRLENACLGLLWMSEADFPWEIIYWQDIQNLNGKTLLDRYNYNPERKIKTTTLESFFAPATTEQEWYGSIERAFTQRYQILKKLLQENLEDIQVYLVGEVEIDVYVLGKSDRNAIIGISTKIVET